MYLMSCLYWHQHRLVIRSELPSQPPTSVYIPQHVPIFYIFYFFSSRRRHTRLQGDWSSDVCSSDLDHPVVVGLDAEIAEHAVLALGEGLPAKAREARERERRLDVIDVHVLEASLLDRKSVV